MISSATLVVGWLCVVVCASDCRHNRSGTICDKAISIFILESGNAKIADRVADGLLEAFGKISSG
jgi:hypothetical protein